MSGGVHAACGTACRKAGQAAEVIAALWQMAKGYQILGIRLMTRRAEIDLIALAPGRLPMHIPGAWKGV